MAKKSKLEKIYKADKTFLSPKKEDNYVLKL